MRMRTWIRHVATPSHNGRSRESVQSIVSMMLKGRVLVRFYSTAVAKSQLATLRRRSGFPIMKCKEALMKHQDDIEAAEKWLQEQAQKEGWAKVAKMAERQAKQGLIGLALGDDRAAMVEVNCETDFVARNDKFQALVSSITQATLKHLSPKLLTTTKLASLDMLISHSILNITNNDRGGGVARGGGIIADKVAEIVGHLQEKIVVPRGCTLCCTHGILCAHVYKGHCHEDDMAVQMGPYGTVLHMIEDDASETLTSRGNFLELKMLGERICQHIVGFNPDTVEETMREMESQALVNQRYLFDESVTVGELLQRNRVRVTRFVRYAVGEKDRNSWANT